MPQAAPDAHGGEEDNGDIPPAFHEDMTLREKKASFKSNKGALTRLSNQVKIRAETFIAIKSPGSATQLNGSYNKFLAKCDFLQRASHQLALEDEENSVAWTFMSTVHFQKMRMSEKYCNNNHNSDNPLTSRRTDGGKNTHCP